MEPQQQDVLQRFYRRLVENIEPKDFLVRLGNLGAFRGEAVETVLKEWTSDDERESRAEWLLENLRNHNKGMDYLVKGLLLSGKHDFLARELLEDELFEQNDIQELLESLKNQLNEIQQLKLELLKECKNHEETKRQLDEVKSNRTSAIFSDYDGSYCSGYEGNDVGFLIKELEEERKRREKAEQRTDELVESHQQILRHFKSVDDIRCSKSLKDVLPWKAASVADLCVQKPFEMFADQQLNKWPSIDSGAQMRDYTSNRNSFIEDYNTTGVLDLAQKVSSLETRLLEEINKRQEAESEIMKLENENRTLHVELFETRDELYETRDELLESRDQFFSSSQLELIQEAEQTGTWDKVELMEQATPHDIIPHEKFPIGRTASCPLLTKENILSNQNVEMRRRTQSMSRPNRPLSFHEDIRLSHVWQNRNSEHYEMDQYENEIKYVPKPTDNDFRFALRQLKLDTWKLYNDAVISGLMISSTCERAKRLSSLF